VTSFRTLVPGETNPSPIPPLKEEGDITGDITGDSGGDTASDIADLRKTSAAGFLPRQCDESHTRLNERPLIDPYQLDPYQQFANKLLEEAARHEQDATPEQDAAPEQSATPEQESAVNQYRGHILVRMPASLHRDLVSAAEAEGISLNQFVCATLAGAMNCVETRERPWRDALERGEQALGEQRNRAVDEMWRRIING
jgi:predicted HicB family RNase H-like nuclease